MVTVPSLLAQAAARALIAADAEFFRDLMRAPSLEPIRAISVLALMPLLSMFIVESAAYVERLGSVPTSTLAAHRGLLSASRMRLKILDDDRKSLEDILSNLRDLSAINCGWFLRRHSGFWGPLKRLLQDDLGVFFINGELICTTHVAFVNLGLSEQTLATAGLSLENLGPYLRGVTYDFGRYLGPLLVALRLGTTPDPASTDVEEPHVSEIRSRDFKSRRLYERVAGQIAPGRVPLCILLTAILSQVNAARLIVPVVATRNPIAAFKLGFVSVFHAASSLQKLLNPNAQDAFFHEDAVRLIGTALKTEGLRRTRQKKALRNALVHYVVSDRQEDSLSITLPLLGLVEAVCAGQSMESAAADVRGSLDVLAEVLGELLPIRLPGGD
jgi:hypothetical protein